MLKNILVVLHVATAAGWFGLALILGSIARKAMHDGGALREVGTKAVSMMDWFISLTFVLGVIVFIIGGAFAAYGPQFHMSLTLVLVLVAVQLLVIRPAWGALAANPESGRKKLSMGLGTGHLIWVIVLVLMFWNHYPVIPGL